MSGGATPDGVEPDHGSGSTDSGTNLDALDVSRVERFAANTHWPLFERLRREDPVHYCADSAYGPYWSVTRLADIVAVEADTEAFSSRGNIIINDVPPAFSLPAFATLDPPAHTRERLAAAPAVAPERLARLETELRAAIAGLLDALPFGVPFDWPSAVSAPITNHVVAALFDWPREEIGLLPYWCEVMTATPRPGGLTESFAERDAVLAAFKAELMRIWHGRARGGGEDVLSRLARHADTRAMGEDPDRVLGVVTLIAGANEAARGALSGGVLAFHAFPEQWLRLRDDPSLLGNAISEIVRWQSPVMHMRRTATREVSFQGRTIAEGARVVLWYCSGNRDEAIFDDASAFRIDRADARRHVGYGFGVHRCFGRHVAEFELRLLWQEALKRFSRIEVVGEPQRFASNFAAGFESLTVRVYPR